MPPDLIRAALTFLQRTEIRGGEAMAMVQVCQALEAMMRQEAPATGPLIPRRNGEDVVARGDP